MAYLNDKRKPSTSKVTITQVLEIKTAQEEFIKQMSRKYGVPTRLIRDILTERTWRQIKLKKV